MSLLSPYPYLIHCVSSGLRISCDNYQVNPHWNNERLNSPDVCLYAQDMFSPGMFQHAIMGDIPNLSLAQHLKDRYFPKATLAGWNVDPDRLDVTFLQPNLTSWTNCQHLILISPIGAGNFSLMGPHALPIPTDIFGHPYGSYDLTRKVIKTRGLTGESLPPEERNLFVYASRDGANRGPLLAHSLALQSLLQQYAAELGLDFVISQHNDHPNSKRILFQKAAVVVGPHGGTIGNILFSHRNTVVIEIQPARSKRFCWAMLASAMGFPSYGVFVASGWPTINDQNYPIDLISFNETMFAATSILRNEFSTQTGDESLIYSAANN